MKNIHVLPTDKPSKLFIDNDDKKLRLFKESIISKYCKNQNIYITSDEEIKEGDYFIAYSVTSDKKPYISCASEYKERKKEKGKIILTNDKDLIKNGVQAIDDEFLEWFVKNPSCEEVEIEYQTVDITKKGEWIYNYKIIIPKEEPKQDLPIVNGSYGCTIQTKKQEPVSFESFDKEKSEAITTMGQKLVRELQSSMEQETLEEAVQKVANSDDFINGALFGSLWQQERMYSEEEVRKMLEDAVHESRMQDDKSEDYIVNETIFEFKKK